MVLKHHALHHICIITMFHAFRFMFTLLQCCVLVGLDWAEPMKYFSLHVTCLCIFMHTYLQVLIFLYYYIQPRFFQCGYRLRPIAAFLKTQLQAETYSCVLKNAAIDHVFWCVLKTPLQGIYRFEMEISEVHCQNFASYQQKIYQLVSPNLQVHCQNICATKNISPKDKKILYMTKRSYTITNPNQH